MDIRTTGLLARARQGGALAEDLAMALTELPVEGLPALFAAAALRRDSCWGKRVTFSPKVFLPLTNLCRNRCDYCSFRRSPGDPGEHTMRPDEVDDTLAKAREVGCVEALFCLGDKPESAFGAYRRELQRFGHASTVDFLYASARRALELGLLPHTNAGILDVAEMTRLQEVNVSLGLMLENVSTRLCLPGMPHHRAPDKRPERRLAMIEQAGKLRVPFTTGILVGIGETRREQVESLLAIRALHRQYGHIQEVIVQGFRNGPRIEPRAEPEDQEVARAVAMARLILDDDVSVQAPPNLHPGGVEHLLKAGINDWGGISPITPDYINPQHPWPHLEALAADCARLGYTLAPRLPIHGRFITMDGFLHPMLAGPTREAADRMGARGLPDRV